MQNFSIRTLKRNEFFCTLNNDYIIMKDLGVTVSVLHRQATKNSYKILTLNYLTGIDLGGTIGMLDSVDCGCTALSA